MSDTTLHHEKEQREQSAAAKPWYKRLSLTTWIFIALVLGVLCGLGLQSNPDFADTYIKPIGTVFLNLIKMIVVPLVLTSCFLCCGLFLVPIWPWLLILLWSTLEWSESLGR